MVRSESDRSLFELNHKIYIHFVGEYEFRCQFLTEKIGKLTEKKGPDRENWDLTEKIGIDREKWD